MHALASQDTNDLVLAENREYFDTSVQTRGEGAMSLLDCHRLYFSEGDNGPERLWLETHIT